MTTKHTPGPWVVRPCGSGYAIDYNADQEQICDHVYELPDARLIAAAPALLEALKLLLQDSDPWNLNAGSPWCDARRAIALATLDTNEQSGL